MAEIVGFGQQQLLLFMLILSRLSFMFMAMPSMGNVVPRRVKALIVIAITFLLMPVVGQFTPPKVNSLVELAIVMGREAMVGALIGLVVQLLVTGLQLAGELISSTGGMQLGAAVDPQTQTPMPVLGTIVGMLVTAVFITLGGHRLMMDALLHSFETMPPGTVRIEVGWVKLLTYELTQGMATGVRAGAPVLAALLLSNLITGLLSRTLPQLNILAIGLNVNALALLSVSAITLGAAGLLFETELAGVLERLRILLATRGIGNG